MHARIRQRQHFIGAHHPEPLASVRRVPDDGVHLAHLVFQRVAVNAQLMRGFFEIHKVEQIRIQRPRERRAARRVLIHHADHIFAQIRREGYLSFQRHKEQRRTHVAHLHRLRARRQQRKAAQAQPRVQPLHGKRL